MMSGKPVVASRSSRKQTRVLRARLHRVDELLGAVIPDEDDDLQQSPDSVETESQHTLRLLIIEGDNENRP